jgi:hypothetical protein
MRSQSITLRPSLPLLLLLLLLLHCQIPAHAVEVHIGGGKAPYQSTAEGTHSSRHAVALHNVQRTFSCRSRRQKWSDQVTRMTSSNCVI